MIKMITIFRKVARWVVATDCLLRNGGQGILAAVAVLKTGRLTAG
jgi:hypothetical protein